MVGSAHHTRGLVGLQKCGLGVSRNQTDVRWSIGGCGPCGLWSCARAFVVGRAHPARLLGQVPIYNKNLCVAHGALFIRGIVDSYDFDRVPGFLDESYVVYLTVKVFADFFRCQSDGFCL